MIPDTIKQRLRASLLFAPPPKWVYTQAARYAEALQPDGSWPDVPPGQLAHLERTLLLAKGLRAAAGALDDPLRRAFDFWLARDFAAGGQRGYQIHIPKLVGEIALLCEPGLSPGASGKVSEILARSRWADWVESVGWVDCTGTTLLDVAYNQMLRGTLENAPSLYETAFGRIFREIRTGQPGEEGIQSDMTFRPSRSEKEGGGLAFMRGCARFIALAHGTPWQAPAETVKLFAAFVLDGQQWTIRHETVEADAFDEAFDSGANHEEMAMVIQQLAQAGNPPRRHELAAFAHRLQGHGEALTGHRYFWQARLAVHQRPEFSVSLRLGESPSATADGRMCMLRADDEYHGLAADTAFPIAPPGSTTSEGVVPGSADAPDGHALAGGVSEGDCGLSATELRRPGLTGKKAWFFFDQSVLCLGADIHATAPADRVRTTVNHCRLRGGARNALTTIQALEHDGFCYVFPEPTSILLQADSEAASLAVSRFRLQIDHGPQPRGASYRYHVLPADDDPVVTAARLSEEVASVEVLANRPGLQAARHRGLGLLGAAFWEPGVILLPGTGAGRVAANHPCLLLCRETPDGGTRLSIANLGAEPAIVHVEYGGRCVCFELPGGPESGRSLNRLI